MAVGQAECDALHFRKNTADQPWQAAIDRGELVFPPYEYRPFPKVGYHAQHEPKLFADEAAWRLAVGQGWAESPAEAEQVGRQAEAARMTDAAVRAYDDRHMSEQAQAEVRAEEVRTSDVVTDLPVPPKRRGRPRKTGAAV